jgi:hypothetical protein
VFQPPFCYQRLYLGNDLLVKFGPGYRLEISGHGIFSILCHLAFLMLTLRHSAQV